ncbi:MAG: pilin [Rhodanobacteraceae bacterium]
MKTVQKGFTLIELMIVVAIIAILAAIAIPAYQNYLIRAQVTEGLTLMDGAKVAMTEYYADKGAFPTTAASAGLATAASITGKYVSSVSILTSTADKANIVATFGDNANGAIAKKDVILQGTAPTAGGTEDITWTCNSATTGATVDVKYLPASCRD